jgi:hypothetical protein
MKVSVTAQPFSARLRRAGYLAIPAMVVFVVVLGLPACNPLDPCGNGARLTAATALAADQATSCVERVTYNDHAYTPWCTAVQPRLLVASPKLVGAGYEGRLIDGVAPEQAIAVGTLDANVPGSNVPGSNVLGSAASPSPETARHFQRHCGGVWRFAPEVELAQPDAEAIAKRVTIAGTLKLK